LPGIPARYNVDILNARIQNGIVHESGGLQNKWQKFEGQPSTGNATLYDDILATSVSVVQLTNMAACVF
jgi:hypothetical protein